MNSPRPGRTQLETIIPPTKSTTYEDSTTVSAYERLIGRAGKPGTGPVLLVVAGIHGNEPAGIHAARRVLPRLRQIESELRGEIIVYAGNTRALSRQMRYVHRDLNRGWSAERIADAEQRWHDGTASSEDVEQVELHREIDGVLARAQGPVHFLDLHTTSSAGFPFAMILDGSERRRFALHFPIPVILGLLEAVDGVLLKYMNSRGCMTLGVEGGQNQAPESIDHHEAVLWLALVAAGLLREEDVPEFATQRGVLETISHGLPRLLEVKYRHAIRPEDQFRMIEGFDNIHRVEKGRLLAHDVRGEIRAHEDGIVFLPLYQSQGDDGFFFGREIAV